MTKTQWKTPWGTPAETTSVVVSMMRFTAMTPKVKAHLAKEGWTLKAPGK